MKIKNEKNILTNHTDQKPTSDCVAYLDVPCQVIVLDMDVSKNFEHCQVSNVGNNINVFGMLVC